MTPLPFRWDGEAMQPLSAHWSRRCDKECVVGEVYRLAPIEERSQASHRHYFASINEAWMSLPEHLSERFDSPEKLRKYALIKAGYCDQRTVVCGSKAEAHRIAAFMRPMDEFALVLPFDSTVTVWVAKSQSLKAMGKADFQKSKDAVLQIIADMLGTKPEDIPTSEAA